MNRLLSLIIFGIIILNLLGFFMDLTWDRGDDGLGYFGYGIQFLGNFPYWIFATLTFLAVNGIASLYFAGVHFHATARDGNYQGDFPLPPIKLLGINLILIPSLIVFFIIVRAIGL